MFANKSAFDDSPAQHRNHPLPPGAQTVLHSQHDHEERIVALRQNGDTVQIIEHSRGLLTEDVFESPWRTSSIYIPLFSLQELFSCASPQEALSDAALFFLVSDRYLSEFMDFLDANAIPFRHEITLGAPQPAASLEDP